MKRVLVLNNQGLSEVFSSVNLKTNNSMSSKIEYISKMIISQLNEYNSKLNITEYSFRDLKKDFKHVQQTRYTGLIVEEFKIDELKVNEYKDSEVKIITDENGVYVRRIVNYVFFSPSTEGGRNVIFSQSVFPSIIEYMNFFKESPSLTIANHPLIFVNLINKKITARVIKRQKAALLAMDFGFIDLFSSILGIEKPKSLYEFLISQHTLNVNDGKELSNDLFSVDFSRKHIILKSDLTTENGRLKLKDNGELDFNGSSEKFYWMEILPIAILGVKENFTIDLQQMKKFYEVNSLKFGKRGKKLQRYKMLIDYIERMIKGV